MTLSNDKFSRDLTAITMGIDAFERSAHKGGGPLDSEGLVPIYIGTDLIPARAYESWAAILADLDGLEARLPEIAPPSRKAFAEAMLRSLRLAVRLFQGEEIGYAEKLRDLVGAPDCAVDPAEIEAIRAALDTALRGIGVVRGSLSERIAEWEQRGSLSGEDLESTYYELLREGQIRTDSRIFPTGDYTMALNPVRGVPYTARCNFKQAKMDLNVDLAISRAAIKHLVAHEVFPGHATQLLMTRSMTEAGTALPETLLCTANTVLGCVQEGIGDEGVNLIDWVEDANDFIYLQLRSLRSATQTSAGWYLMVENWSPDKVADYLRETAAGQDAWVKGRIRMASHPFRGPFIASYWAGAQSVSKVLERVTPKHFREFVTYLYGNAHSPQSLEMFEAA